ncbi:MAG: hypothetical protein IH624_12755 [Phycisphaerae bacterium]|nr:hypothetical protein [Phycisphaerae bacterium]
MIVVYIVLGVAAVIAVLALLRGSSSGDTCLPENVTDDDICLLAQQGRKIQAIKYYRKLHGTGLREAKEAVERMIETA